MPSSPAALALKASNGRWKLTRHLALLDWALVNLANRQATKGWLARWFPHARDWLERKYPGDDDQLVPFNRLVVEMPPRHGKSELVSRWFPAWYLGCNPEQRVILVSYAADYARSWGRRARDVLREHGERFFGVKVKGNTDAANDWEIEGGDGGMLTAGIGGPITGRGGNLNVIDDGIKNADEAGSKAIQQRNEEWYDSTFSTRYEPDAIALIMGTRWNQRDPTGYVLQKQAEDEADGDRDGDIEDEFWFVLKLPALAEPGDVLGRAPGEALWSERYPKSRLERIKRRIGSYFFGALFQQQPSPAEGGLFPRKWWQRYREMPSKTERGGIFVDTATDDEIGTDYTAIATWRTRGPDFYVERVVNARLAFPDQVRAVLDARAASMRSPDDPGLPIYIEETAWALPLIKSLKALVTGVIGVKPGGHSKVARAMAATPVIEAENVYLPESANWVGDFIEQHAIFTGKPGEHDDMVDTTSLALHVLFARAVPEPPETGRGRAFEYTSTPQPQATSLLERERAQRQQQAQRGPLAPAGNKFTRRGGV